MGDHVLATTVKSYPLRDIPKGSEFAVSLTTFNYMVKGVSTKVWHKHNTFATGLKAHLSEPSVLRNIIGDAGAGHAGVNTPAIAGPGKWTRLGTSPKTLPKEGVRVTLTTQWLEDVKQSELGDAGFAATGYFMRGDHTSVPGCASAVHSGDGAFINTIYEFPKTLSGGRPGAGTIGFGSRRYLGRRAPVGGKVVFPWNDKADPKIPNGCAPIGSKEAKKYGWNLRVSERTACAGFAPRSGGQCHGGAARLCAPPGYKGQLAKSNQAGTPCGDTGLFFATMDLEALRDTKNFKLVAYNMAPAPFKVSAQGTTTLTYWWKPPSSGGLMDDAACSTKPGELRFANSQ